MSKRMLSALLLAAMPALCLATQPKLGLWQNTVTMNFDKPPIQIPQEQLDRLKALGITPPGTGPQTHTAQRCLTQADLDRFQSGDMGGSGCTMQNPQKTDKGFSGDLVCASQGQNAKGHVDIVYDDDQHYHGTSHVAGTMNAGGMQRPVEMTMQMTGQFVSATCPAAK